MCQDKGGLLPPAFPKKQNIFSIFSKNDDIKMASVLEAIKRLESAEQIDSVAWFLPKKHAENLEIILSLPLHVFPYEILQKTNKPFNIVTEKTLIVIEGAARYKSINTYVFGRMSRISLQAKYKVLVDIVPFRGGIENLYMPWAYLGREILGHQHWYAFRENYLEKNEKGQLIEGLSDENLARKIAPYTAIDYENFFTSWETKEFSLTEEEQEDYQAHRAWAFSQKDFSGHSIMTYLADFAHTMPTRYEVLKKLCVEEKSEKVLVYTNIKKHNRKIQQVVPQATVRTFYEANGDEGLFDKAVLFELPISRGYLLLDALAYIKCPVVVLSPVTPVEKLLWGRVKKELDNINKFTKTLKKEVVRYGKKLRD